MTPPDGTPLAGYYRKRLSEGVLDDLYSKALVVERDGVKAAIVVCDILTLPRHVVESARRMIERQTGIPGANMMIGATHTHTSPVVSGENTRDMLDAGNSDAALKYTASLPDAIAQSVAEANRKLAPARRLPAKTASVSIAVSGCATDRSVGIRPSSTKPSSGLPDRSILKSASFISNRPKGSRWPALSISRCTPTRWAGRRFRRITPASCRG
jgi:hypothetical protein